MLSYERPGRTHRPVAGTTTRKQGPPQAIIRETWEEEQAGNWYDGQAAEYPVYRIQTYTSKTSSYK